MKFTDILLAAFYGILEGVTEWLPVSSTGHLILLQSRFPLPVSEAFFDVFEVLIQFPAILAVVVLYFHKLNPFSPKKSREEKQGTWNLWFRVLVAMIPTVVFGLLLDDILEEHLNSSMVVAIMLIVYGVLFLFSGKFERKNPLADTNRIGWKTALGVGLFQVLSMIPGTSRSGATIMGGLWMGLSRGAAAEFSFFLAIPTMAGASLLRSVKFFANGGTVSATEGIILAVACVFSFLISLAVIRTLTGFVRKHSFAAFGIYRIVLGILILVSILMSI